MSPAVIQALIRAGRTIAAAAIASAVTLLPQIVLDLSIPAEVSAIVVVVLASLLNGLGKLVRGESVDVAPNAPGDRLPF